MKRILSLVAFFATLQASAQQVNPVPDYVFANRMSAGRNTVTDTAAYFSIGPRYGATKGFMPPIVGDTATFSSGKRNGLLIFSVQKNKFLYWDSVRVQWSDMAGSSGSYIVAGDTATMLLPYLRKADTTAMLSPYYRSATATAALALKLNISDTSTMLGNYIRHAGYGLTKSGQSFLVDTLNISTRAWRQKGIDSVVSIIPAAGVGGSGTTNYIPKITAASTIGNSQIFDNGTNVGIGITTGMSERFNVANSSGNANASIATSSATSGAFLRFGNATNADGLYVGYNNPAGSLLGNVGGANAGVIMGYGSYPIGFGTNATERLRIFANGRVFVGASPTDAGYQFDVNGTLRAQGGAALSASVFSNTGPDGGVDVANTGTLAANRTSQLRLFNGPTSFGANDRTYQIVNIGESSTASALMFQYWNGSTYTERMRINSIGDVGINQASPSYKLDINGTLRSVNGANFATSSGNVGIGTASPAVKLDVTALGGDIAAFRRTDAGNALVQYTNANTTDDIIHRFRLNAGAGNFYDMRYYGTGGYFGLQYNGNNGLHLTTSSEVLINTTSDAGDYKLQVVGNARVGTGKLDIASNTTFGLGIARSGTSEVAGQIYNSNGILYTGVESSAGGQIFTGSSAYAAVIGSGANYPFQIATNNITRATMTTQGNFMLGFTTDSYFYRLQVNGSIFTNNQILIQNNAAQLHVDSTTNLSPIYLSNQSLTGTSAQGLIYGNMTWNTTGAPSAIDLNVTNTASGADANYIKITDGSNIFRVTKDAGIITGIPSGGSAKKWKLGAAATVSPTSPNRTIQIEVDGVIYYLHAKTTND